MTGPFAPLLGAAVSIDDWRYVLGSYVLVVGLLVGYVAWVILRARRVARHLPADERTWL